MTPRRVLRATALVLVACGGLTCTDGPTGPSHAGGPALVRVTPTFSQADVAMFDALAAFGITIDNVHIHIDHPPAAAFDTIIPVLAGSDSLVLNLPVILNSATEQLLVQIELRNGTQVLFSGTQTVTANAGTVPSVATPGIPIVYVGPGAAASRLTIAPRDTAILVNGGAQYRFAAVDSAGGSVEGVAVQWSVGNTTIGTIDNQGVFSPSGVEGRTQIVALTANGLRDSTSLVVTAPPTHVVLVSGGNQTGAVGTALASPMVVEVQSTTGVAVPGVTVTFSAPATASVNPVTAVSGIDGRAQTTITLGVTAGMQSFSAGGTGLTGVIATDIATHAAATVLTKVSGDAQTATAASTLPLPFVVKVTDAFNNVVPGATVNWARVAGLGTLAAGTSASDSTGLTHETYALGATPGIDTVSATVSGVAASRVLFTTTATSAATPAAIIIVSGNGQSATAGSALATPLIVRVADSHGNPVAGTSVAWSVTSGGGAVTPASSVTDSTGATQATLTVGTVAGSNLVNAGVDSAINVSFSAVSTAGAASVIAKHAGDAQTVLAGTALPVKPSVIITDSHANPVAGAIVTFSVASGGGTVTGASDTTNASGIATVGSWTIGATGTQKLSATSGVLVATFTATISAPTSQVATVVLNSHSDTLTSIGDTYQFTAQARDTANAPLPGKFTWVSRTPATATVDSTGVVKAVANGSTWLVSTDTSTKRDSALVVVQQRIATVLVTPGTRSIYLTQKYQFTAAAVDGNNHPIASALTFTWATAAPAVAAVDTTGLVNALGLGSAQVSATAGAVTGVTNVSVITPITRIEVGRDSVSVPVTDTTSLHSLGDTRTFLAIAHDTLDAPMTGVTFTWASTNQSVALLDSTSSTATRATSAANGITSITAKAQGITGSAPLSVAQQLAGIHITPDTLGVAVSGSGALTARGVDARGRYISGGTFTYTSLTPAVATVNASTGVVTGVANGTAFVTASSGAIAGDTAVVTVGGSVPAAISFGHDTISVGRGSAISVPIYLSKPNGTAVTVHLTVGDTTAYWTSANVTIPQGQTVVNATLNGHNAGTTVVTATDSSGTGFAPDTAVLAVQATMKLAITGYGINVTDQFPTQVLLSDPSPAGGTYVTFSFGTPGVATVSPNPAFIPAGQLAADIQLNGASAGTTTITPVAIGVNGAASTLVAYAAQLKFNTTGDVLGIGQYDANRYVYLATNNSLPVQVTLTSSDSTIISVPSSIAITGGGYYAYFNVAALSAGTATITASAPGWTSGNTFVVTATTPHLGVSGGTALTTTSPTQSLTVYAEDSLHTSHTRTNSLVVHLRSSDTTVMQVLDTIITISPSTYYNSARVIPGGSGGAAYVVATASGHTPDSTHYTVTGPKLSFSWTTNRIGAGQEDHNLYVSTPNNVTAPLTVTLAIPDTNGIVVPTTITIPTGTYYTYFNVRAKTPGTDSIVATAPGYQSDTASYIVTTPRVGISGGGTMNNFGASQSITLYAQDSVGTSHYRSTPLVVSLASSDPTVLAVDSTSVTIAAGTYYTSSPRVTPIGIGTARLVASAAGHLADSSSFTVQTPKLSFSFNNYTIGKGQHRNPTDFYIQTPDTRTSPLSVTITQAHPTVDSLTATTLNIPAATYYSYFSFYGLSQGLDTLITTAPGYLPDTAFIRVTTAKLTASSLPSTTTTTNPPIGVTVYTTDSLGTGHYSSDTLIVHAVSSDSTVIQPGLAYFPILKNTYYTNPTVNIVGPGSASITYSDSAGTGYLPVTTNIITVTGPSLSFSSTNTVLGMRQSNGPNGIYVYTPNNVATPLTVNLVSTDPRVATAPASVTIPTGSYYAYFPIVAQDTLGTIQIQASALGYNGKSTAVQVTQPKFAISGGGNARTTSPNMPITVYAEDANGNTHFTTEDVVVTLASSSQSVASIDSTTVTIASGQYYNSHAKWAPGIVGTAQLSATDTRAALYAYAPATVSAAVATPNLNFGSNSLTLGIGQYIDNLYVATQDNLPAGGTVTLTHTGTPRTTTVPANTLSIANNSYYAYYRLIGASTGTDTLVASMTSPLHNPGTAYTVVGTGRIDPLSGWPATSLAVGDSVAVTLYARDPAQNARYVVAATTWTLAPNSNIEFHSGGQVVTSITVPANAQYVTFYVKAIASGTASATITAPNYQSYTNTFTVTP